MAAEALSLAEPATRDIPANQENAYNNNLSRQDHTAETMLAMEQKPAPPVLRIAEPVFQETAVLL